MNVVFERPESFIPERWYNQSELAMHRSAFHPFGAGEQQDLKSHQGPIRKPANRFTGKTTCVGQGVAMAQIRMVIASVVKKYRITFAQEEHPDRILLELKDQLTLKPGKLMLRFEKR